MIHRSLTIIAAFLIVVGVPSLWLYFSIIKRKRLLYSLLKLPKDKRFFWYRLRKEGFKVIAHNTVKAVEFRINGESRKLSLKMDFTVKRKSKKYAGIFAPELDEKESLKLLFTYSCVFNMHGIIFYRGREKDLSVWEL